MNHRKRNTDKFLLRCYLIVAGSFLLCACFGTIGVILSWQFRYCDQTFRNNVITIYSAFVSSFLTLFGVILSILSAKAMDLNRRKHSHEPEFYLPCRYDIAKAMNYHISSDEHSKITIPNNRIFFQNTDKTGFLIEEVSVFGKDNNALIKKASNQFIDKELLFFLSFYCEEDITKISIKTKSIDGYNYMFEIDLDNKTVRKI